jgi:hypothetical protein
MAKTIKSLNNCPVVVKKATGIVGGTNTPVKAVTSPTRYTGGFNKAACDVPTGKLKK